MSRPAAFRFSGWDSWLAAACSGALGIAGVLVLAGSLSGSLSTLVAAGVLGLTGLALLLASGWVEALLLLVVALPLPALYATDDARLSPVLPVAALIVAAWYMGRRRTGGGTDQEPRRAMVALVAAVTLASFFAEAPVAALREVVNFAILLGILQVAVDLVGRRPDRATAIALWLAVVAATAGGAAVLEAVGFLPGRFPLAGSGLVRAAGGFGWPNELGMFLAISFPFTLYAVRRATGRVLKGVAMMGAGLAALGLVATFSRGSWLAVLVAPAVLFFAGEGRVALRFWGGALVAVVAVDLLSGGALSTRVTSTTGDVLVVQRLFLMAAGLLMFQAHPVVGVGPGGFGDALDHFGLQVSGLFDFVGSAHNGYVHMAAEAGALGLAALLYFLVSTLRALHRGLRNTTHQPRATEDRFRRAAFLWSFATACLVTLFEWPFAHGVGELIILVAGAGVALAPARHASP